MLLSAYSLDILIVAILYFAGQEFQGIIVCWTIQRSRSERQCFKFLQSINRRQLKRNTLMGAGFGPILRQKYVPG
jgi:hypothetical protein